MRSKVNEEFNFNVQKWVVSLINTKKGCHGVVGGHAKIIVEGLKEEKGDDFFKKEELFIAEYHIMEANAEGVSENHWIKQTMINTKCDYVVLFSERNEYTEGQEKQYEESGSNSWYVSPKNVNDMIKAIKQESIDINGGITEARFEYFGKWSYFGDGGYNCVTWAEDKLAIAGIGNGKMLLDSSKGVPSLHTSNCTII
jgi:hypothetical protein